MKSLIQAITKLFLPLSLSLTVVACGGEQDDSGSETKSVVVDDTCSADQLARTNPTQPRSDDSYGPYADDLARTDPTKPYYDDSYAPYTDDTSVARLDPTKPYY